MQPGDSALANYLDGELKNQLEIKIEALINSPDQRTAGYIEALRDIRLLLGRSDAELEKRRQNPRSS